MNKYFLPEIKELEINDYDLYKCPLKIDFTKKLSIIFGTNGTGKSTLLHILLYSIIGPYKETVNVKLYKDERRDNRKMLPATFFRNRMKDKAEMASVIVNFEVNKRNFKVKHSLYKNRLLSVMVDGVELFGELVDYPIYENKYFKNDKDIDNYLIHSYHAELERATKLPDGINSLISMLFDVIFFGEDRNYTFWNKELQDVIIAKYIVDPDYYLQYVDAKRDAKYKESRYKKASETKNYFLTFLDREKQALSKFLNARRIDPEGENSLDKIQDEIEAIEQKLLKYQKEKQQLSTYHKKLNSDIIEVKREIERINDSLEILQKSWYEKLFPTDYYAFYNKHINHITKGKCPICKKIHHFDIDSRKCIFCNEALEISNDTRDINEIDALRKDYQIKYIQTNDSVLYLKKELKQIDLDNAQIDLNILELQNAKISLQQIINKLLNIKDDKDVARIKQMDLDIKNAQNDIEQAKAVLNEKQLFVEESLVDSFKEFSKIFEMYGKSFFGEPHLLQLSLPPAALDESKTKIFDFSLDGIARYESNMLSESQRIFTDFAFRFAILTQFHNNSFFICETPDSSLDIFHEAKAVDTFNNYIQQGNNLILTANARNSKMVSVLYGKYKLMDEIALIDLTNLSSYSLKQTSQSDISFENYLEGLK